MASQVLSGADLQRTLNEEVDPVLRDEIARRVTALKLFKLKTVPVSGKYYRIVVKYGGNFYGAGRPEMGKLPGMDPTAAYQDQRSKIKTLQLLFYKRFFYTTVDMTGPVRNAPQTASGGFGNLGKQIMDDTVENLKEMVSLRYASGQFGIYGKLKASGAVSGNTVTMEPASVNIPFAGNRLFREGMVVDTTAGGIATALRAYSAGVKNRGRLIDSVGEDSSTPTITMNDIGTAGVDNTFANGDHMLMFNSRVEYGNSTPGTALATLADYQTGFYQPMGIMDAVYNTADTQYAGAYYGDQDPTTNRVLQSIRVHNSGTARIVSLDHINLCHEQIEIDPNGGDAPNLLYTTPSVRRQVMGFLTPTVASSSFAAETPVRYNDPGSRGMVNVGVAGIEITTIGSTGKKVLYTDPLAPTHRLYLANTKTMMILQDRQPGFIDDDGLTLRMEEGTDSFFAGWKWYQTGIINWHRRKSGVIVDASGDHLS